MYCSKCGSTIAPNTGFCQICGNAAPLVATAGSVAAVAVNAPGTVSPHWLPPVTRAYAGFWLRFVAHLVDGFLLGALFLAICIPVAMLTGLGAAIQSMAHNNEPDPAAIAAFASSIALLIAATTLGTWLYYAYFESSDWQGTIGKKVMSLVVTDLNGNRISFARASGRFFAKIISGLIPFAIGYILAGVTEKKQALHDMIASCLVLRS
jgi:uncharacterized RDD family membrane protein YckC